MLNFQQKEKNMEKFLPILKKCPLFDGIDDESMCRMLTCLGARVEKYGKKDTVLCEGERAADVGILISGEAQTVQIDYYGNRSILGVVHPRDLICEEFACAEEAYIPVSVVAEEPSEVMFIDCSHILHTCSNNCGFHQQLIYNLMKCLAVKTIAFHDRIDVTSKRTTREKLLAYLTKVAKKTGKSYFEIPFDRQELADYLEVDRAGLSAEIGKLKRAGIIDNRKNCFKLL